MAAGPAGEAPAGEAVPASCWSGSGGLVESAVAALREGMPDFEIKPRELDIDMSMTLGCGSTSVVYLGRLRGDRIVAVKDCLVTQPGVGTEMIGLYLHELEVWSRMSHPHLLRFFGYCPMKSGFRICSEYCRGGTLFDLLHNCWHVPLGWWQRRKILVDLSLAVEHMHNLETPIMHRDLKSLNVFLLSPVVDVNTEPQVKLADFGFARIRSKQRHDDSTLSELTQGVGTPHWMAPEVASGTKYFTKVDVFSFSIIIYEVICRHMAFEDLEPETAMHEIMSGGRPTLNPEILPPDIPAALLDLMVRCWDQEPTIRPTISQVADELQKISWPIF